MNRIVADFAPSGDVADMATWRPVLEGLRRVLETNRGDVTLTPASCMAAWEEQLGRLLAAGDRVVVLRDATAARHWDALTARLALRADMIDTAGSVPFALIERLLGDDREGAIRAVVFCSGAAPNRFRSDVSGLRAIIDRCFHDALLLVDSDALPASGGVGMDASAIDLIVAGLPGSESGFALVGTGPRARAA